MANRYYVAQPIAFRCGEPTRLTLAGSEAHHLIHVMRAAEGTQIVLFDGSGAEFPARIDRLGRAELNLTVLDRHEIDREPHRYVALAVSLPKGDRQRWLVEKAVELGVAELIPLTTSRSVAQPVRGALERLRRAVVEASKQCGRNRLMQVAEPTDWPRFVETTRHEALRLLAHPTVALRNECLSETLNFAFEPGLQRSPGSFPPLADRVFAAVGPEGGLALDEVNVATAAGWRVVDLGPRILRTETAALVMATRANDRS